MEPLRHEAEAAVAEEGWTKVGLEKMYKIDSFLRETQRLDCISSCSVCSLRLAAFQLLMPLLSVVLIRFASRPFTFSNGITIPAGTTVAAPLTAIHTDGELYPSPSEFDGFRFAKLREQGGDSMGSRHQTGATCTSHVTFGHWRHAWSVCLS
jgi:hypothetical protein